MCRIIQELDPDLKKQIFASMDVNGSTASLAILGANNQFVRLHRSGNNEKDAKEQLLQIALQCSCKFIQDPQNHQLLIDIMVDDYTDPETKINLLDDPSIFLILHHLLPPEEFPQNAESQAYMK